MIKKRISAVKTWLNINIKLSFTVDPDDPELWRINFLIIKPYIIEIKMSTSNKEINFILL